MQTVSCWIKTGINVLWFASEKFVDFRTKKTYENVKSGSIALLFDLCRHKLTETEWETPPVTDPVD